MPKVFKNKFYILVGICLLIIVAILANYNSLVMMAYNDYGNPLLFIACAIIGSFGVFYVGKGINKSKVLEFFGKNSIIVLTTQFPLFRVWDKVLDMLGIIKYVGEFGAIIICFILTLACEVMVIKMINRCFPLFAGKFKEN